MELFEKELPENRCAVELHCQYFCVWLKPSALERWKELLYPSFIGELRWKPVLVLSCEVSDTLSECELPSAL